MAYKVIPFEEFKEDCRHLAAKIAKYSPTNLFGMMRGGMVVALFIAHELDMDAKKVYPLYKSARAKHGISSPIRWPHTTEKDTGLTSILIDDIFDTGKTEEDLQCTWPWLKVAVLYCKNKELVSSLGDAGVKPLIGRYIDTKDYLILPHEVVPDTFEGRLDIT